MAPEGDANPTRILSHVKLGTPKPQMSDVGALGGASARSKKVSLCSLASVFLQSHGARNSHPPTPSVPSRASGTVVRW